MARRRAINSFNVLRHQQNLPFGVVCHARGQGPRQLLLFSNVLNYNVEMSRQLRLVSSPSLYADILFA